MKKKTVSKNVDKEPKKIVKKAFFCLKEKKAYKIGDEYKGSRNDLKSYVE